MIVSIADVHECLQFSCFPQTPQQQQDSMKKLQEFDNCDGYVGSLSQIIQTLDLFSDIRLLATICLKNLVNKCWTVRGRARCLNETEKSMLRQFITNFTNENDDRIAIQLAIMTARMARYDWPNEWPELLPTLFNKVCQDNMYSKFRCMFILRNVLNEVSTKRALSQKNGNGLISAQLFNAMISVWLEVGQFILSMLAQLPMLNIPVEWNLSAEAILKHFSNCTSVMHKLLSLGFDHLYRTVEIQQFFQEFLKQFTELSSFIRNRFASTSYSEEDINAIDEQDKCFIINEDEDQDGITCNSSNNNNKQNQESDGFIKIIIYQVRKLCYKMAMLPVDLQKTHPLLFVPFLGYFLPLFQSHLLLEYNNNNNDRIRESINSSNDDSNRNNSLHHYHRRHHHHHPVVIAETLLLSNTLSCRAYSNPPPVNRVGRQSHDGDHSQQLTENENMELLFQQAKETIMTFFHPNICSQLLAILLSHLLQMTNSELLAWVTDPEEFADALLGEIESDSVRTAAEGLFLGLLDHAPSVVVPIMMQQLQDASYQYSISSNPDADPSDILRLDALYLCAGIGVAELSTEAWAMSATTTTTTENTGLSYELGSHRWLIDICGHILANLCHCSSSHELTTSTSASATTSTTTTSTSRSNRRVGYVKGCPVLKRRLLWMFSCWTFTLDVQSLEQLLHILVTDIATTTSVSLVENDAVSIVTLLQSVDTITSVITTSEFKPCMLSAQLGPLMQGLCQLTLRLEMSSFRSKVVDAIGEIVLAMGPAIKPSLLPLTQHLCELWNISANSVITTDTETESEDPLRPSLLETLSVVVKEARSLSVSLHIVLLPILAQVISKGDQDSCGFKEGIALWLSLLRNSSQYSEPLQQLFQSTVSSCLSRGEAMRGQQEGRELLMITQAYALLGGLPFLTTSGSLVMSLVHFLLEQSSARNVTWIMRPVEMFLIVCSHPPLEVCSLLLHSGFMTKMLQVCSASSKELGPYFADHLTAGIALVEFLSIFARIVLLGDVGLEALRQAAVGASAGTISGQTVLLEAVKVMIEEFDAAGCAGAGTGRRKLWVVSLLSLFPTSDPTLMESFADVLLVADGLLCELEVEEGSDEELQNVGSPLGILAMATAVLSIEGSGEIDVAGGDVELGSDDAHSPPFFDLDAKVEPIVQHLQSILSNDVFAISTQTLRHLIQEKVHSIQAMVGENALNAILAEVDSSIIRRLFLHS